MSPGNESYARDKQVPHEGQSHCPETIAVLHRQGGRRNFGDDIAAAALTLQKRNGVSANNRQSNRVPSTSPQIVAAKRVIFHRPAAGGASGTWAMKRQRILDNGDQALAALSPTPAPTSNFEVPINRLSSASVRRSSNTGSTPERFQASCRG